MSNPRLANEPVSEVERLAQAAREALTDSMVERLAMTGANALELVDRINDAGANEAMHALIDRLAQLHKVGAIDTLFETVLLLHAARNAATDSIVERLFTFFEQTVNTVGTEAMGALVDNARLSLDEAAEETERQAPRGGIFATLALLAKPESQKSLMFLMSFAEKLRQRTTGR